MLAWIAVLSFILVTGLAAARLLVLWRETRCLPELLIAILILGVGTIAVGSGFLIPRLMAPGPARSLADFTPMLGAGVGMIALSIFTWQVYRPSSSMAKSAVAFIGFLLVSLIALATKQGSIEILSKTPFLEIHSAIHVAVMLWSATEAIVYWLPMRRRLVLGLADPLVVNRFLLWGIATGTAGIGIGIGAAARIFGEPEAGQAAWVSLNYALHGMVSAVAFWLAFKPPRAYARWVRGTAVSASS